MNPKLFDYKSGKRTMYSDTFELADMVALWHILYSLANFNILLNFVVKVDRRDFRAPNTGDDVYNSTVMKWIYYEKNNCTRYINLDILNSSLVVVWLFFKSRRNMLSSQVQNFFFPGSGGYWSKYDYNYIKLAIAIIFDIIIYYNI